MHHHLKAQPDSFALMRQRKSNVQLRKNDRDFKSGDTCTFYEWDEARKMLTGCVTVEFKTDLVLIQHEGLTPGWCLIVLDIPQTNIVRFDADIAGKEVLA